MDRNNCCIIIVDEDRRQRADLEATLDRLGYHVVVADGREGLFQHLERGECSILIVSSAVCRDDTSAFLETVHRRRPDLSVVMLSDLPSMASVIATLRGGACDYLPKPYTLDQLIDCLDRAVTAHKLSSAHFGTRRPITAAVDRS